MIGVFALSLRRACVWVLAGALILSAGLGAAVADEPSTARSGLPTGKAAITLVAADGARLTIGSVTFTPDGDGATVAVSLDAPEFGEEFLSMRPFRCLAGAKETWCHLAYPYTWTGRVTAGDLTDLEYALLFLFKPPAGYGIDAWNGLYFKLAVGSEGGLTGDLHEADFNVLAVPPDSSVLRPITHADLTASSPEAHRFARIEIR